MDKTIIYFDAEKHRYTNEAGNAYISATTIIGKYETKFDEKKVEIAKNCERIGKNPNYTPRYKYLKYKGLSYQQILAKWEKAKNDGCDRGNKIHDNLESNVKKASGYYEIFETKYKLNPDGTVTLYTLEDILENPNSGQLDLEYFIRTGIKDKYPKIFAIIQAFVNDGWRIYSEVAVFNNTFLISGLIDILFVKGMSFCILDWKTNKAPIKFEAGYWEKDENDTITNYKYSEDTFKYPLHMLPYSIGNKYSMQLSLYDYLAIQFGFKLVSNILCHITHDNYKIGHKDLEKHPNWLGKTRVETLFINYLETSIIDMINDYELNRTGFQQRLFN